MDDKHNDGQHEAGFSETEITEIMAEAKESGFPTHYVVESRRTGLSVPDIKKLHDLDAESPHYVNYTTRLRRLYKLEIKRDEAEESIKSAEKHLLFIEDQIKKTKREIARTAPRVWLPSKEEECVIGWDDIEKTLCLKRSRINELMAEYGLEFTYTNDPTPRPRVSYADIGKFFVKKNQNQ